MKKIALIFLASDLVILNAAAGYLLFFKPQTPVQNAVITENSSPDMTGLQNQVDTLQTYVENLRLTPAPSPVPTGKPEKAPPAVVSKSKTRTVVYLNIPGSGQSLKNVWESLSGTEFYFNKADYPGLLEVRLEANMKLFNGSGMAYVRLSDETHGMGVQGSEVSTNSQANTIVTSGLINFWSGNNLYRIQARSLTADTAVYNSGRLRIVQEY